MVPFPEDVRASVSPPKKRPYGSRGDIVHTSTAIPVTIGITEMLRCPCRNSNSPVP